MAEKYWAYTTATGYDTVYAADIEREKRKSPVQWQSPMYYSAHEVGSRLPMYQRSSPNGNGPGLFYYRSEDKARAEAMGEGETLSHALCKRAVSELRNTTLKFGKSELNIEITEATMEKTISLGGKQYRPDVSLRFKADSPYELKWDGALCVEIYHTHAVEKEKAQAFFHHGLAMIEVHVSDKLLFTVPEESVTREIQDKWITHLKTIFTTQLFVKVLSDPKSHGYLTMEVDVLSRKLQSTANLAEELKIEVTQLQAKNSTILKEKGILESEISRKSQEISIQKSQNTRLDDENQTLQQRSKILLLGLCGLTASILVGCGAALLHS